MNRPVYFGEAISMEDPLRRLAALVCCSQRADSDTEPERAMATESLQQASLQPRAKEKNPR